MSQHVERDASTGRCNCRPCSFFAHDGITRGATREAERRHHAGNTTRRHIQSNAQSHAHLNNSRAVVTSANAAPCSSRHLRQLRVSCSHAALHVKRDAGIVLSTRRRHNRRTCRVTYADGASKYESLHTAETRAVLNTKRLARLTHAACKHHASHHMPSNARHDTRIVTSAHVRRALRVTCGFSTHDVVMTRGARRRHHTTCR